MPEIHIKFDVYVNDDASSPSGQDKSEFVGSFVHVRHRHGHIIKTKLTLGITQLLEDLGDAKDGSVVVTLVLRNGEGKITIVDSPSSFLLASLTGACNLWM